MKNSSDFLKKFNIIDYHYIKRFKSKKNNVSLYTGSDYKGKSYRWIKKEFRKKSGLEKELRILKFLKQNRVRVPQVYFKQEKENVLIMEYIEGTVMLKCIEECEENNIKGKRINTIITALLNWLNDFYDTLYEKDNYIMEDINLRNYIIKDNKIWGLDFEDCCPGTKERDIGRICAFTITYSPSFSEWKVYFVKEFLKNSSYYFDLNMLEIKKYFIKELYAIEERRDNIKLFMQDLYE